MKKLLVLICLLCNYYSYSQSITIFDVDMSTYPIMRAKFFALDSLGNQITNLSPSDFSIVENGLQRQITSISCPPPKPIDALSSLLIIDVSGSMGWGASTVSNLELAKASANAWVSGLPLGNSECAITTFDHNNYLNQDFTTDRQKLLNVITTLEPQGGTDYNAAFIEQMAGGLLISKRGIHKRVIVFLTDGEAYSPSVDSIVNEANRQNCVIYCVTLGMAAPQSLHYIANNTGGKVFENITTIDEAQRIYSNLLQLALGNEPCTIEWESASSCTSDNINVEFSIPALNLKTNFSYSIPLAYLVKLEINPNSYIFRSPMVGTQHTQTIKVTSHNATFNITDIKSSNSKFTLSPKNFILQPNESILLTLTYQGTDSISDYAKFIFESNICEQYFYSNVAYKRKKPYNPTLKLVQPNGGEKYIIGGDSIIKWEGISPDEFVMLDLSINNGKDWERIAKNVTGLKYNWKKIPKPESNSCLIRVSQGEYPDNYNPNNPAPVVNWLSTFGGNSNDIAMKIIEAKDDGSYFIIGTTSSSKKDTSKVTLGPSVIKGGTDIWVLRVNPSNKDSSIIWEKTYGGYRDENVINAIYTKDNNILILGETNSNNGDVTNYKGTTDIWAIKINPINGSIIWEKTLGGSLEEKANSLFESSDGTYTIAGYTESTDGDLQNSTLGNIWIVKLNPSDGQIYWQKTYQRDFISKDFSFIESTDGSFVVSATTIPQSEDSTGSKGRGDILVSKFNKDDGAIIWENVFGGSFPEKSYLLFQSSDASYFVVGTTESSNGEVTINKGGGDIWVLKINSKYGNILWEKTFGGSGAEVPITFLEASDASIVLAGSTSSYDGDFNSNKGGSDAFLFKFDQVDGKLNWITTLGGSNYEIVESVIENINGSYVVAGYSSSKNGDLDSNRGSYDYFISELDDVFIYQSDLSDNTFSKIQPLPISKDIDVGKCVVNTSKDTLIANFIYNNGSLPFKVNNIYLRGADASAFTIISGFPPYLVNGHKYQRIEFRFVPNRVGVHNAELVIITQSDTLIQKIKGEGIDQSIEIVDNIIDFGIVNVGKYKDTIQVVTIKNISNIPINIIKSQYNLPNMIDFTTISGGGNFILQPQETKLMNLRFSPRDEGRTSGTLEFHYNGVGSPATIQLFGEGIKKTPKLQTSFTSFSNLTCEDSTINTIELINKGGDDLIIKKISIIGTDAIDFKINEAFPITIYPDSIFRLNVKFKPTSTGYKSAVLQIESNSEKDSILNLDLYAVKNNIDITVPNNIDLGYLCPNEKRLFDLEILNNSSIETNIDILNDSNITISLANIRLNIKQKDTLRLEFEGLSNEGIFTRKIVIRDSCNNEKEINIVGIIEAPKVEINNLDFISLIGVKKQKNLLITNNSNRKVTLNSIDGITNPFSIVGNPFPLEILPHTNTSIMIEFNPVDTSAISNLLEANFDECSFIKQFEITGRSSQSKIILKTIELSAFAGEEIEIPIILDSSQNILLSGITSIDLELDYNPTLLAPLGYDGQIRNDSSSFIILKNIPIMDGNQITLLNAKFIAGLGNAKDCELKLSIINTNGGTADVTLVNGKFNLLGICNEGGTRLINPFNKMQPLVISPNPSDGNVEIKLYLLEKEHKTLNIFNNNGILIEQFDLGNRIGELNLFLNTSKYLNGLYFIQLQTPTIIYREKLIIIK